VFVCDLFLFLQAERGASESLGEASPLPLPAPLPRPSPLVPELARGSTEVEEDEQLGGRSYK